MKDRCTSPMQHTSQNPSGLREPLLVFIRGAGDLGTGIAHRLHRAGFPVIMSELEQPTVIRRAVAFASAVYEGRIQLEGVEARLAGSPSAAETLLRQRAVPVLIDPAGTALTALRPDVLVDARLAKRNLGTTLADAPVVIGLGPGFTAGQDVDAVIETSRGHFLGRVILRGSAQPDTGIPGVMEGYGRERVLWAPCAGSFVGHAKIGAGIEAGQVVASVAGRPVRANISGVLRGVLHDGLLVHQGQKVGDIDPRGIVEHCFTISDKARAIGGAVLEAILYLRQHLTATRYAAKLAPERGGRDDL
jgi:xanthine dehydrogenase accessory factor